MLLDFFTHSPLLALSIVVFLVFFAIALMPWERIKWWWFNFWYSFPLIGRMARLSRDLTKDSNTGWYLAEKRLCEDYKSFLANISEDDYKKWNEYLKKAGDLGRRETPKWVWVLTAAMVFVEAMGFSYVLAGYTLPGASENLQQLGAYGIAFLISVLLVAFTHLSGRELYKSSRIAKAHHEWKAAGQKGDFRTGEVSLEDDQKIDDDKESYTQLANRVGDKPSYKITIATAIFVVIVAVLATYVRGEVLEKHLLQTITGQISNEGPSVNDPLNFSKLVLPNADEAQNRAAERKALEDEIEIDRAGGWGTFIVLAVVFVFLQLLGVVFGYLWGFAGKESHKAYHKIKSFPTFSDLQEYNNRIASIAEAKLTKLQTLLKERNAEAGRGDIELTCTFRKLQRKSELLDKYDKSSDKDSFVARLSEADRLLILPEIQLDIHKSKIERTNES
ncbi:MAG TPA: hypothetical protein PKI22_09300 [Hydrogenophilus thermoluteolus]|nr:hypothetical protein [Hydrogenophilus thermoluteolus]